MFGHPSGEVERQGAEESSKLPLFGIEAGMGHCATLVLREVLGSEPGPWQAFHHLSPGGQLKRHTTVSSRKRRSVYSMWAHCGEEQHSHPAPLHLQVIYLLGPDIGFRLK